MKERPVSRFWRILPYPFYVLAALIGLAGFLAIVVFVGWVLGLWPLPNDH
jgi:hypothetical protein